jgi:hypothetical protein
MSESNSDRTLGSNGDNAGSLMETDTTPYGDRPQGQPSTVTQICTLRFRDGQIAVGRIEATSRYQECMVVYSGAVERLPIRYATADSVLLRVLFQSFARELRARFQEELLGDWEPFPDDAEEDEGGPPSGGFSSGGWLEANECAERRQRRPGSGG